MSRTRCAGTVTVALTCVLLCGCGEISTEYGKSKGISGRSSLNGFGALRTSYARAGFGNRDVSRLSDRVMLTDVIVWTPQILGSVDPKVTRWFERWLSGGGRTLVYIVPDSGSEADYWIEAARLAPPEQRLEYRRRAAKSVNERMLWRLNRVPVGSNGWFRIQPLVHRTKIGEASGAWKDETGARSTEESEIAVEYFVVAFDTDEDKATSAGNATIRTGPTGPGTPAWTPPADSKPTKTPIQYSALASTETGDPIVAEVRSSQWKDSKIIVIAGGSLLTNYAFARPHGQRLAERIIAASTPAGNKELSAGFLTSNRNSIPVTENKPGVPQATGMELLTVWPMSLVTMHGVMLGLVICLMLLPVFGRPKRIHRSKQSHFGDHLDAVAALMNRAGGERYARGRISEYMKRMHGEISGPWVLPDLEADRRPAGTSPVSTSDRLASKRVTSDAVNPTAEPTYPSAAEHLSATQVPHQETENDEADR